MDGKLTDEELKAAMKRDAEALARLILDIYLEKKRKESDDMAKESTL